MRVRQYQGAGHTAQHLHVCLRVHAGLRYSEFAGAKTRPSSRRKCGDKKRFRNVSLVAGANRRRTEWRESTQTHASIALACAAMIVPTPGSESGMRRDRSAERQPLMPRSMPNECLHLNSLLLSSAPGIAHLLYVVLHKW